MKTFEPDNQMPVLLCLGILAYVARGILIWFYPQSYGDADVYLVVAENILQNSCVSLSSPLEGICKPVWGGNQLPGYPAFIALVFALFDHSLIALRLAQALLAVFAILYLCAALQRWTNSSLVAVCTGVLLALSPLSIGWPRHVFTETFALAVTTWVFAELIWSLQEQKLRSLRIGLILALAAFIRIDLLSLCLPVAVCAFYIDRPMRALRNGMVVAVLLALPLVGWSVRSILLGLPALPPMAITSDGSPAPAGYLSWGNTWSSKEYHLNLWAFPVFTKSYSEIAPPAQAYRDANEKARVEALLAIVKEHDGEAFPAEVDAEFAQIAIEKQRAAPFFHWIYLPLKRSFEMWLNPFSSAGLPAAAELPGTITPAAIRQAVTEGISGMSHLILQHPELTLFKAASLAYRAVLLLSVLSILLLVTRGSNPTIRPLLTLGLVFAVGRTAAFAMSYNNATRYIVEAAIPLEIICGVFLGLLWEQRNAMKLDAESQPVRR